ncbi:hypothetical protein ACB094_11G129800 [Castanea mollissima]
MMSFVNSLFRCHFLINATSKIVAGYSMWREEIREIYGKKKNLVVGLCADTSHGYGRGFSNYKGMAREAPFQLLQLCVGSHCLLYNLDDVNYSRRSFTGTKHKVLKGFLYDKYTTVVGVGIKEVAQKLERETGVTIKNPVELRKLAEAEKSLKGNDVSGSKLADLAKRVLGEHMHFVKPKKTTWWSDKYDEYGDPLLSNDVIKYATVEAFLAYEIGSELLRCSYR